MVIVIHVTILNEENESTATKRKLPNRRKARINKRKSKFTRVEMK
jgi:hypothetical protein